MPTTTNYGWPTPASVDPADVPADFAALAGAQDTTLKALIDARDDNYQTLLTAHGAVGNDLAADKYALVDGGCISSGASTPCWAYLPFIYLASADYAVASKTQKLRTRFVVAENATSWSSVTITLGLYPMTSAGGADTLAVTLGTVVPGSTVAAANPLASNVGAATDSDFTIPADGAYCLGFTLSAPLTDNAFAAISAVLQTRWV